MNPYGKYLEIVDMLRTAAHTNVPVALTAEQAVLLDTILFKSDADEFAANYLS